MHRLTGIGVSPGVAAGRAVLLMQNPLVIRFPIGSERVAGELARLEEARQRSRRQLREIKERVAATVGAELSALFDAQLLMLDDTMLVARARDLIARERVNAEWAVQQAFEGLAAIFEGIEDPYLRERKGDVADVAGRLRMNLAGGRGRGPDLFRDVDEASVLVADDLTPSMAAQVDWRKIRGFASDTGSHTHHTAILARSLHVPAVVGLREACRRIPPGATVMIDGSTGELILDPSDEYLERVRGIGLSSPTRSLGCAAEEGAAATRDGVAVALRANIELPEDVAAVRASHAEGVGLYRSEFLLATTPPDALTEDVQYQAYRALLEGVAPGPLTVRTFDVGEEQLLPWAEGGHAAAAPRPGGPLGLRAVRLSLARREVFKTQLRALLRTARHGELRVIFPFVSGLEELREARAVLREAMAELEARGESPGTAPPVGAMIEIPSAAVTADLLAREADFFSIGTNDLIQYTLAVDRTDAGVSALFDPLHPAVLRIIRTAIRAARRRGLPISLCGEMAADPVLLPLLVGLGLRDFSMSPSAIPTARCVIRRLDSRKAERLAARVLRLDTAAEIARWLSNRGGKMEG